mmetsp:Transcript_117183/g.203503  ORF Transcript_117183/g.203503 Transcript_117183/m.203503 type:complete len:331 (-) Transcript_117183:83-1075(-)
MHAKVLALACLACAGLARKVQHPSGQRVESEQRTLRTLDGHSRIPGTSKAFAELLLTHNPAAGWQVTGAGPSPIHRYHAAAYPTSASAPAAHSAAPTARRSASPNLLIPQDQKTAWDIAGDYALYAFLAGVVALTVYTIIVTLQDTGEEYGGWRPPEPDEDEDDFEEVRMTRYDAETGQWVEKRVVREKEKKAQIGRVKKSDAPELNRYQKRMIKQRKRAQKSQKKLQQQARRSGQDVQMMLTDSFDDRAVASRPQFFPRLLPRLAQLIAMLSTVASPGSMMAQNTLDVVRSPVMGQEWVQKIPMAEYLRNIGLSAPAYGSSNAQKDEEH